MDLRVSLDGAAGLLLLGLPWLLLAWAAWRATHSKNDAGDRLITPVSVPTIDPFEPFVEIPPGPLAIMAAPPLPVRQEMAEVTGPVAALQTTPLLQEKISPAETESLLRHAIERATDDHDHAGLARMSVELAQSLLARSTNGREAATLLQSAVRAAHRAKLPAVHAEARIELAAIAIKDGDLTSACEHWQMAKTLFHETGRRSDQDRMADLMRRHRCPTDWVLTNF